MAMQLWWKSSHRAFPEPPCLIYCHQNPETSQKQIDSGTDFYLTLPFAFLVTWALTATLPRNKDASAPLPADSPAEWASHGLLVVSTDTIISPEESLEIYVSFFPEVCNAESWEYSKYFAIGFRNSTLFYSMSCLYWWCIYSSCSLQASLLIRW